MANKDGIQLSYRGIGIIAVTILGAFGMVGIGGFQLSTGVSIDATEDIRETIQEVISVNSLMTPEEAVDWADERALEQHRIKLIDETLTQHGDDIADLKEDVYQVQRSVDANQETLEAIAARVGAEQ